MSAMPDFAAIPPEASRWTRRASLGLLLASSGLASAPSRAEGNWPTHMVRVISPGPAGSYGDAIIRPVADHLARTLGKPFVVENRPGANSSIGVGEVARAAPDGHAFVITNSSSMTVNPQLYKKLSYTPEQLAPVTPVLKSQFVLTVNPAWAKTHGIENVADLVKWAKANPGKLRYSSAGLGNIAHLTFAMLSSREKLETVHVPYKGQAPAQLAVMSGEVEALFDIPSNKPNFEAGKSKPLAVTAATRIERLPNVPTMAEAGFNGYEINYWMGIFTTAGTPAATVQRMHEAIAQALRDPKIHAALSMQGDVYTESPAAFAKRIQDEIPLWGEIIRRERIEMD